MFDVKTSDMGMSIIINNVQSIDTGSIMDTRSDIDDERVTEREI